MFGYMYYCHYIAVYLKTKKMLFINKVELYGTKLIDIRYPISNKRILLYKYKGKYIHLIKEFGILTDYCKYNKQPKRLKE